MNIETRKATTFQAQPGGIGYTVSEAVLIQVYGIFWPKFEYNVLSISGNLRII